MLDVKTSIDLEPIANLNPTGPPCCQKPGSRWTEGVWSDHDPPSHPHFGSLDDGGRMFGTDTAHSLLTRNRILCHNRSGGRAQGIFIGKIGKGFDRGTSTGSRAK